MLCSYCKLALAVTLFFLHHGVSAQEKIVVGSKNDAEGKLLGEIMAQLLEDRGFAVERRFGLGGTLIAFQALVSGEVDAYPEYTGTLSQAIMKLPSGTPVDELRRIVHEQHRLELLQTFGFNNTYALVVRRVDAEKYALKTIGDLNKVPAFRFGFSHEFLQREDGWPGLKQRYGLSAAPIGINHGLVYEAMAQQKLDVVDVYSTDASIQRYDLVILEDDRNYFPTYLAAPLVNGKLPEAAKNVLNELAGTMTEEEMIGLNARRTIDKTDFPQIAHEFLLGKGLLQRERPAPTRQSRLIYLLHLTLDHLKLTAIAMVFAILVAIPAGVLIYRVPALSRPVLYLSGLLQTIPSIALLAFMIPLFGIGVKAAIVALFLYALLPILRNTATGLFAVDPLLKKVATGMGLTTWQRLRHIEIPLAAPTILAGIKTATVINIGTATLAAFIGAGGLGVPIVTGIELNDSATILEGAIPAALLAIVAEFVFELMEKFLVPRHLLQKQQ